jgi:hypothetical protein
MENDDLIGKTFHAGGTRFLEVVGVDNESPHIVKYRDPKTGATGSMLAEYVRPYLQVRIHTDAPGTD